MEKIIEITELQNDTTVKTEKSLISVDELLVHMVGIQQSKSPNYLNLGKKNTLCIKLDDRPIHQKIRYGENKNLKQMCGRLTTYIELNNINDDTPLYREFIKDTVNKFYDKNSLPFYRSHKFSWLRSKQAKKSIDIDILNSRTISLPKSHFMRFSDGLPKNFLENSVMNFLDRDSKGKFNLSQFFSEQQMLQVPLFNNEYISVQKADYLKTLENTAYNYSSDKRRAIRTKGEDLPFDIIQVNDTKLSKPIHLEDVEGSLYDCLPNDQDFEDEEPEKPISSDERSELDDVNLKNIVNHPNFLCCGLDTEFTYVENLKKDLKCETPKKSDFKDIDINAYLKSFNLSKEEVNKIFTKDNSVYRDGFYRHLLTTQLSIFNGYFTFHFVITNFNLKAKAQLGLYFNYILNFLRNEIEYPKEVKCAFNNMYILRDRTKGDEFEYTYKNKKTKKYEKIKLKNKYLYVSKKRMENMTFGTPVKLCVITHNSRCDLTLFEDVKYNFLKNPRSWLEIQTPIVTCKPVKLPSYNRVFNFKSDTKQFDVQFHVRDNMLYCTDNKSLKAISEMTKYGKLSTPELEEYKSHMQDLYQEDIQAFYDYAVSDSATTLNFAPTLFKTFNLPLTTGSFTTSEFTRHLQKTTLPYAYVKIEPVEDSNTSVIENLYYTSANRSFSIDYLYRNFYYTDGDSRMNNRDMIAVFVCGQYYHFDPDAHEYKKLYARTCFEDFNNAFKKAYRGGMNQCYNVGYIKHKTFDIDLKNAYPTVMCMLPRIDYSFKSVFKTYNDIPVEEAKKYVTKLINYCVAEVEFDLDMIDDNDPLKDVINYYGLVSIKQDDTLVFVRSGKTFIAGPTLYACLKLGCIKYIYSLIVPPVDENTHLFKDYLEMLIEKRSQYPKGSVENLVYKLQANGLYGKLCQGGLGTKVSRLVPNGSGKYIKKSEVMPKCAVSNVAYGSLTTDMCRLVLILTMAELSRRGYDSYSVTTDGFISDCNDHELINSVLGDRDSHELSREVHELFTSTRASISRRVNPDKIDTDYYEFKHNNDSFFNVGTRTNASTNEDGVLARGNSHIDKNHRVFVESIIKNDFKVTLENTRQTLMTDILNGKRDYIVASKTNKDIYFDYDYKRVPDINTIKKTHIDSLDLYDEDKKVFENVVFNKDIINFNTNLYENIEDFIKFKRNYGMYKTNIKKVLATKEDDLIEFFRDRNFYNLKMENLTFLAGCLLREPEIEQVNLSFKIKTQLVNKILDANISNTSFRRRYNQVDCDTFKKVLFRLENFEEYKNKLIQEINNAMNA